MEDLQQQIEMYRLRFNNPARARALVLGYLLALLAPLVIAWISEPASGHRFPTVLGRNLALAGVTIIMLQFVLASRLKSISEYYGLDMVLRFHKAMGGSAALLLLVHPFLVAGGSDRWHLLYSLQVSWPIWLGRVALLLLLAQAVTSLLQRRWLAFETWRNIHNQALLILGLAIMHSWQVGGDLQHASMQALWLLWVAVPLAAYGYHKIYRPLRSRRHAFLVQEVRQESHQVWTVVLEPPAGAPPPFYLPGQFHFLKFHREGRPYNGEEHHFTISSSPTQEGIVASTIKESGDFTATVRETRPGDTVQVQGAFGRFCHLLHSPGKDLVFIAGGIGITPVMSMLRYMRDAGAAQKVVLLYANRTEKDILFGDELALMAEGTRPRLRVAHVLTNPSRAWKGEYGRIDQGMIRRYCGIDTRGLDFYLCGPPGMMKMIIRELRELGALPARIHNERFWF